MDKHWKPFISRYIYFVKILNIMFVCYCRCGYCDVPYKIIAKAENFSEDQKFIGRLANVTFQKIGKNQIHIFHENMTKCF